MATPACRAGTPNSCATATVSSVIDLSSTNGTYVVPAGHEPADGHGGRRAGPADAAARRRPRLLGAWSRLTVRLG